MVVFVISLRKYDLDLHWNLYCEKKESDIDIKNGREKKHSPRKDTDIDNWEDRFIESKAGAKNRKTWTRLDKRKRIY